MLDSLFYKKRSEASRILTGRMNHQYAAGLNPGERLRVRCSYCEVVWLIQYERGRPRYEDAKPAVSKDISPSGLSLILKFPLEEEHVVVGMREDEGMVFIRCRVGHCTSLGCGFFQVGLAPEDVVQASNAVATDLRRRFTRHSAELEAVAAE